MTQGLAGTGNPSFRSSWLLRLSTGEVGGTGCVVALTAAAQPAALATLIRSSDYVAAQFLHQSGNTLGEAP